jgi:hypothetical protein
MIFLKRTLEIADNFHAGFVDYEYTSTCDRTLILHTNSSQNMETVYDAFEPLIYVQVNWKTAQGIAVYNY